MPDRKRAAVTEHFKNLENSDTKVPRVQCLFCQISVVKNGTLLKPILKNACHVLSCSNKTLWTNLARKWNESDSEESVEN